ncbi:MAG: lysophospholipid acyltransferase family protein [Pyrinomonadaceae bacterium]|nr:lysophospholipid acyltransferase family protein [Pyrinomonadaceae bacterium]
MDVKVKKLNLVKLIFQRQGSFTLRLLHIIFGIGIKLFFRRIETVQHEKLPKKSSVIFVSNHPNALIDPMLLFVALPRNIAFLAKSTLFKMPIIGFLIKKVGALPLYRQQDKGQDVSKNAETFTLTRELLKKGGVIAIFPEGISHNESQLQPLKTGAARIALGAVSVGQNPNSLDLKIVPVGLYYTNKTTFRSEALLHFGESIQVLPCQLDENGQPQKDSVKELTTKIEENLRQVTLNAESESKVKFAQIAEEVFTSVTPHRENLGERLEFLQKFVSESPTEDEVKLKKRLVEYNKNLNKLGIESEFLGLADLSKWFVLKQAFWRSWYLLLLSPLAIFGTILHIPAYYIGKIIGYTQTKKGDYDMASTVKLLAGLVLMPLTWIILAVILNYYFDWKIALLSIPFSFLCGYIALRSIEEIIDLNGWLNAITAFFFKREKFLRLLAERKDLFEKLSNK